eukprot:XP_011415342.1 PREDICTED: uncharacterized protein LOC105319492 [Crassostrea gigas]
MASEEVLQLFNVKNLKKEQEEILGRILDGKDCLAVLPTGYGKSLPYQIAIPQQRAVGREPKKIIVCCPLIALMKDQVERLSKIPNIRAMYRDGTPEADRIIRDGAFDCLFGSPELLVGDSTFRDQLHAFDVSTIVVHEFHTIACWVRRMMMTETHSENGSATLGNFVPFSLLHQFWH